MTTEYLLAAYNRMVGAVGETVTIRRYTGGGLSRTRFDADARARVEGYNPDELVGTVQQGDRRIICLVEDLYAAQFALPVLASDKIVVRGKELAIIAVDDSSRRVGGELIALEIQARG